MAVPNKTFQLEKATLAVEAIDGKRTAVTIPAGAVIKVVSEPKDDGLLRISWDGRTLKMFAVDVDIRGTEVGDGTSA